jgi:hypothetical protein
MHGGLTFVLVAQAQDSAVSPRRFGSQGVFFILGGCYILFMVRRLKKKAAAGPLIGQRSWSSFASSRIGSRVCLAGGWICLVFGVVAVVAAIGMAATGETA